MISQQLLDYINQQTQMGKSKEEIKAALIAGGWKAEDVEQGFAGAASGVPTPVSEDMPKARQIFNEAWEIYKARFKTLITIGLIPVVSVFLVGLLAGITGVTLNALSPDLKGPNLQGPELLIFILLGIIAVLALIYISIWSTVAQLFAIKDQAEGIGLKEAFNRSKSKIWMFFGASLLSGLAVLGGIILLIVPGIIFALWFSQSPYIVVEENLSGATALKRSKYYVKGRVGKIFGKLFYMGIIYFGLFVILGIIISILSGILKLPSQDLSWISNVFSVFMTPLLTVYGYQLFKHVKASRP